MNSILHVAVTRARADNLAEASLRSSVDLDSIPGEIWERIALEAGPKAAICLALANRSTREGTRRVTSLGASIVPPKDMEVWARGMAGWKEYKRRTTEEMQVKAALLFAMIFTPIPLGFFASGLRRKQLAVTACQWGLIAALGTTPTAVCVGTLTAYAAMASVTYFSPAYRAARENHAVEALDDAAAVKDLSREAEILRHPQWRKLCMEHSVGVTANASATVVSLSQLEGVVGAHGLAG